jgi:hypothetical protein
MVLGEPLWSQSGHQVLFLCIENAAPPRALSKGRWPAKSSANLRRCQVAYFPTRSDLGDYDWHHQ